MLEFGCNTMVGTIKKVLVKKPQPFMSKVSFKKWNYKGPLKQNLINSNYNSFLKLLKKFNTEIIELDLQNENQELCDSIFTHDPSLVTNKGAIILNMGKKIRKNETKEHKIFYKKINIPIIGEIREHGTVEGGDCVWLKENTLLVGKSYRTNQDGINQLSNILKKFNIKVVQYNLSNIKKTNSCFHLMSLISVLDNNLIIGYKPLLDNKFMDILKKYKYDFIKIPNDEYIFSKSLSVNILVLKPKNLLMIKGFPKTVKLLEKFGFKVDSFLGNELCIKAEGGPTCLTRPILRV